MKNRIWRITVLLAVLALGLAFVACPKDTEDREITFTNMTGIKITVTTDGTPKVLELRASIGVSDTPSGTVTKTGSDITLSSIVYDNSAVNDEPDRYIDFQASVTGGKKVKNGVQLGSGSIVFKPQIYDTDGEPFGNGNPAKVKISVIAP